MSFKKAKVFLAAAVAQNGTITVPYPTGTDSGSFVGTYAHTAWASGLQATLNAPADFTVSFGSSNITVTYKGATSLPANSYVNFQFDTIGVGLALLPVSSVNNSVALQTRLINLGAPAAGAANSILTTSAITAAGGVTLNGALVTNGVATNARPRNIVAAWTGTAVMTVTGTDEYGAVVKESSASGTSFTGKKAFKTVTAVTVSADVTAATVGTGNVFGLPFALPEVGLVLRELQDGAIATSGTTVAALAGASNATSADVRGTYAPNATPDGSKAFQLIVIVPNANDRGPAQYAG